MKQRILLVTAFFALSAVATMAAPPKVGEKPPSISASNWWNLPAGVKKLDWSDLRGQVVIVEFWMTMCEPCRNAVPRLAAIQKKYGKEGVIVIALSREKKAVVSSFVDRLKVRYIVGAGAKATERIYEIKEVPKAFIVGGDGTIEWIGHPGEDECEKNLERVLKSNPAQSKLPLEEIVAKSAMAKAEKLFKKEQYLEAKKAFEQIVEDFKDSKYGKKAAKKLKALRENKEIMEKIRKAEEKANCEDWLLMARNLVKKGRKSEAIEYYERIIKEYPDSEYAEIAEEEKEKLAV